MLSLWLLQFTLLSFPALIGAVAPTRHFSVQGKLQAKTVFLDVNSGQHEAPHEDKNASLPAKPYDNKGRVQQSTRPIMANQEKHSTLLHTPPGLLTAICGALMILAAYACMRMWKKMADCEHDDDYVISAQNWSAFAQAGKLDFYTCMALSMGRQKSLRAMVPYIPGLSLLICMQLILPVLLVTYQAHHWNYQYAPVQQDVSFRVIGTMVYAYSAFLLCRAIHDDCRDYLLQKVLTKSVSGWYSWPIVLGETMNTLVGSCLMVSLFFIFCACHEPQVLLINSIAINYVADIDNQIVSNYNCELASGNFDEFQGAWRMSKRVSAILRGVSKNVPWKDVSGEDVARSESLQPGSFMEVVQLGVLYIDIFVRTSVPFLAVILTFLFATANNEHLCHYTRKVEPWPFCVEVAQSQTRG